MLKFVAGAIDGREFELKNVMSYELSRDIDAACDGLRITLAESCLRDEIVNIRAYKNDDLIFNGYADIQRDEVNQNGVEGFIYARSSACILLDNEAEPRSYCGPTVQALFECNARKLGFKSRLPKLSTEHYYLVNKGVTCFGAINNFVSAITGKNVIITPNNELTIPSENESINFDALSIISEKRSINRGGLVSQVDYKVDGDNRYEHHIKSRFIEGKGVYASKKINLTSLPIWQREYVAKDEISQSCKNYFKVEIIVDGCISPQLYDNAKGKTTLGELDGYYITGVCNILDSSGERTKISLCKKYDLEEIVYVAK